MRVFHLLQRLEKQPWFLWVLFSSVTIGTFMNNVDSSVLNVALPTIQEVFKTETHVAQWTILLYLLISTGILPMVGKLSDQISRKRIFIVGVSVFVVGSFLCGLSETIYQLIVFRGLQAFGGAIMMGNIMSIVAQIFPKGRRGKALGMIGSIVALGTIAGPSIGGLLIEGLGWRSIFFINIPLGFLSIIGVLLFLPPLRPKEKKEEKLDIGGGILFFIAMSTLLLLLANGNALSLISLSLIAVSLATWFGFFYWERKQKAPLIQLAFFKLPAFSLGTISLFIVYFLFMVPSLVIPLFTHHVLKMSVAHMGLLMTSQALAMFLISPVSGWMADRFGTRLPTIIGMGLITVALLQMVFFSYKTTDFGIIAALSLFGVGFGLFSSANNVSVLESVPKDNTGVAGSLIATVRNFGRVTGASGAILLLEMGIYLNNNNYIKATSFTFICSAVLALVSFLTLIIPIKGMRRKQDVNLMGRKKGA